MRLRGKVALVTGAAQGVGEEVVRVFAKQGAQVVCVDRNEERLRAVVDSIQKAGDSAAAIVQDISIKESNEEIVARTVSEFGGLDILHLNAAAQYVGPLDGMSKTDLRAMLATNIEGPTWAVAAAVPHLKARGGGSVIFTSSVIGIAGDPELAGYAATKGGLRALCRSLACALGPANIRVNTICPSDVETPLLEHYFAALEDPSGARAAFLTRYPLGRFATPRDVANVAVFLASDEASYLTGIDIVVDGGILASVY